MTQREYGDPLLTQLLANDSTSLSERDERKLMQAAEAAGPVTLAPDPSGAQDENELISFVKRYPVPSLLAAVAVAYLFGKRR